jgi:hypothetical protein
MTGEIWNSIAFCQRHPSVLPNMLSFSVASALGQVGFCNFYINLRIPLSFYILRVRLNHKWGRLTYAVIARHILSMPMSYYPLHTMSI